MSRDGALGTLGQAGINMTGVLVDNQYLVRAGLYAITVHNDDQIAAILNAAPPTSQGQWQNLYLNASWALVTKEENRPTALAAETRKKQDKAAAQVQPVLDWVKNDNAKLQAYQRLFELAGLLPKETTPAPATPAGATHGRKAVGGHKAIGGTGTATSPGTPAGADGQQTALPTGKKPPRKPSKKAKA